MTESLITQFEDIFSSLDFTVIVIVCGWFLSGWLLYKFQRHIERESPSRLDEVICTVLGPGIIVLVGATLAALMLDTDAGPTKISTTKLASEDKSQERDSK